MEHASPRAVLAAAGFRAPLARYAALDRYLGLPPRDVVHLATDATLVQLAHLFDPVHYPRLASVDAEIPWAGTRCLVQAGEDLAAPRAQPYPALELLYDPDADAFLDPAGARAAAPRRRLAPCALRPRREAPPLNRLAEAAVLTARYGFTLPVDEDWEEASRRGRLPVEAQRELLTEVLAGRWAAAGLSLLARQGFVARHWPELARLATVDHDKDFHPEGDGWTHTLEALEHRKRPDLTLALGILFHDAGKPLADRTRERPFDEHAGLGERVARQVLRRLGFPDTTIADVAFLVRHHMTPAALGRLPVHRVEAVLSSPLFPALLEVFRCDLASACAPLEPYHRAGQVYRDWSRHSGNPFRNADGSMKRRPGA